MSNRHLIFELPLHGAVSEAGWRERDARACAELRAHHASFRWRSVAVERYVDELIAKWRANPPPQLRPYRINDSEDYELPEIDPGETLRNGMRSPGV